MKHLIAILSLAFASCFFAGCATTTTTTNADGTTTTVTKTSEEVLTDAINIGAPVLKTTCKTATILILKNNPNYVNEVGSISTVVAAVINSGSMSATEITTALETSMPDLDKDSAALIGDGISTLWDTAAAYYQAKTGKTLELKTLSNANVDAVAKAIANGVSEGVTAYKASTTTN